jgi:hypothetical protein
VNTDLVRGDGARAQRGSGRARRSTGEPAPRRARTAGTIARDVAVRLPDRIVLVFFWFCLVVAVAVLLETFRPYVVLPVAVVLVVVTWRLVPTRFATTPASFAGSLAALVVGAGWFAMNLPYLSQYVVVTRDPGFLTLEGFWLTHHASPDLPVDAATRAVATLPGVAANAQAYDVAGSHLHVQGAKLVPGLLASVGWVLGDHGVQVASLLIGVLALWAVYAFARRVVGPLWALVPMVALAASVPFAAFTRSAYTEPTTIVLVFAGLTVAWSACTARSARQLALAGALTGSAALARVDSTAQVIGLVAALGIAAACAWDLSGNRWLLRGFHAATLLGTLGVLLGLADLAWHSPTYLTDHASQTTQLDAALVVVIGATLALQLPRVRHRVRAFVLVRRRGLALSAASAVVVLAAFLASRPLWLVERHSALDSGVASSVAQWQAQEGAAIDPARTYDEHSVTWLSWYFGWPLVVLGFAGLALAAHRAVSRRDPRYLVLLGVVGAPSALYLWQISITPDQIWAMRRFLPVTIPGLLIAATIVLATLWRTRSRWLRAAVAVVTVVVVVWPAFTWGSLFTVREQGGRLDEGRAICRAVDGHPVVLVSAPPPYLPTVRSLCGVDAVRTEDGSPAALAAIRGRWGADVDVVTFHSSSVTWTGAAGSLPAPLRTTYVTGWEQTLLHRPSVGTRTVSQVWVGRIGADGTVTAARPDDVVTASQG